MELRRQNRIVFQTKIRLRAPGRDESVVARVQNLSPRGVYITGTELPAAGTEVQCRLVLAGQRRTLRGRIAWVRPGSSAAPVKSPSAGIEFLDLPDEDAHLLHKLVDPGDEERQPVDVWFEGMKAPIRCQAVVAGEGVRLATRLPFMRLHSPVRVAFTGPEPMVREGTVDSVMLEPHNADGVPHLEVNVSMTTLESANGIIDLPGAGAAKVLGPEGPVTPPASTVVDPAVSAPAPALPDPAVDRDRTERFPRWPWRQQGQAALRWLSQGSWRPASAGFAAGALAVALGAVLIQPAPAPLAVVGPPVALSPEVAAVAAPVPAAPAPAPAPVANEPPAAAAAVPADEPELPPEAPALARHVDAGDGVALLTDDQGTRLSVAFTGSSKDATMYRLADPPGIAVTLPRARPRIGSGVTRPGSGPVRLQVRRRPAGSHLRFFFDPGVYKGKLTVEEDRLVLQLDKR